VAREYDLERCHPDGALLVLSLAQLREPGGTGEPGAVLVRTAERRPVGRWSWVTLLGIVETEEPVPPFDRSPANDSPAGRPRRRSWRPAVFSAIRCSMQPGVYR
jgi:hypothetical protein